MSCGTRLGATFQLCAAGTAVGIATVTGIVSSPVVVGCVVGVFTLALRLSDHRLALALLCAMRSLFAVRSAGVLFTFLAVVVDIDLKRS